MKIITGARACAPLFAIAVATPLHAAEDPADTAPEIRVLGQRDKHPTDAAPASTATIDRDTIARTINAATTEDTLKYLPSLILRKRNIGDTQAVLATRTAGLGASARSLVYADGVLLSALIGNNNGTASPRWGLVSPQEIARVDVIYGPFSARYPGNSIGAAVEITTRDPDRLEGTATAGTSVQDFAKYATRSTRPAWQFGATLGGRVGPLSLFGSAEHVSNDAQPLAFVTAARPATTSNSGRATDGGFDDLNRTGGAIRVLGASGIEHQAQDRYKLKAALDLGAASARYVGGLFLNTVDSTVQSYLTDRATGLPAYSGTFNIDGRAYTVAASAFAGGVYHTEQRHWAHAVTLAGDGSAIDWKIIGTFYDYDRDVQRVAGAALPAGASGGAGTITRMDGTGWKTLDASAEWRAGGGHVLAAGAHGDIFRLVSNRYATTDWIGGTQGALNLQSLGRTRTIGLWAEDRWRITPALTLTVGGRYEWWRAFGGRNVNTATNPVIAQNQPERTAQRFSPKATLAWQPAAGWTVRGSYGAATRFPTVAELYQVVTTPVPAVPNPNLKPERAQSEELAVEHKGDHGFVRVALFNEIVRDALVSQSGPLNGTTTIATFVQNVDRTRARGVELAWARTDLVPHFDLSGSVTYADAMTRADAAYRPAEGKRIPGVPEWKATLVATWRPTAAVSLTAAGRYTSRIYGQIDNLDVVGDTYQGFDRYLVVDLRAQVRVGRHYRLGLGVDNVNNDRYFLFHPFPQRTFRADVTWVL